MMTTILRAVALLVLFAICLPCGAAELNSLSDEESKSGWKLLFDGESKAGWRGYRKPEAPEKWIVEDGALKGQGGGDLMTEGQYDYYELSLEFNLPKGGNSGVIYRVAETNGPSYVTGPEIQVLSRMNVGGKNDCGSCYDLYGPTRDVLKPNGEWNALRLIIKPGEHVEHWMNGERVCEYTIGSDDWNDRVAKSKWRDKQQFGKIKKGYICLQDHGNEVWYRNLKIREIKAE